MEEYLNAFKTVLSLKLIENGIVDVEGNLNKLIMRIELPIDDTGYIKLYQLRDDLNDNITKYEEIFGLELMQVGYILLKNLSSIKEGINKRIK